MAHIGNSGIKESDNIFSRSGERGNLGLVKNWFAVGHSCIKKPANCCHRQVRLHEIAFVLLLVVGFLEIFKTF